MPTTEPTWVSLVCSAARAIPKSASFTVISGGPPAGPPMTIRFPGLTSRWMIPIRWAYSRPAQAWAAISTATDGSSAPSRCRSCAPERPSTYSMTMKCRPASTPVS